MRVLEYEAHNIGRVRDIKFDLEGRHLFIVGGKNSQGKTSSLNSLLIALCGKSGMDDFPEVVLSNGQTHGWIKAKLSGDDELHDSVGFTLEYLVTRKPHGQVVEEFRILDSTGDEAPEPRTLLKRLYQLRAFDPLAFERLDRKGKRSLILQMLGLDFSVKRAEAKKIYDQRAAMKKDAAKLEGQLSALQIHQGVPAEEISVNALMEELGRRQAVNKSNKQARVDLLARDENVKAQDRVVAETKAALTALRKKLEDTETLREEMSTKAEDLRASVVQLVDADEAEAKKQIASSDQINRQVRDNQKRKQIETTYADLIMRVEHATVDMEIIAREESEAIKAAKFPVPGMSFDDDGVLLNNLPIEQAGKKERIEASVDIGIALNPRLKLMVSQDGGDLDVEAMAAIDAKLASWGGTFLVEMVTRSKFDEELCAVVIKDGLVESTNDVTFTPEDFTANDLEAEGFFDEVAREVEAYRSAKDDIAQ